MESLRDRIAAAMQSADRRLALADEMPAEVYYAAVADAVIAALGLERENGCPPLYRYITEWENDA